jgi:multidrug transporter EmrE-like cation transporter
MKKIIPMFIAILIIVLFESIGMSCLTYSFKNNNTIYYIIGSLIYGLIIPYSIKRALSFENISTINFIWNILTTVTMIIIGYLVFSEKLNFKKILAFIVGLLSIFLLYTSD